MILVIEDDERILKLVLRILKYNNLNAIYALNGQDAIKLIDDHSNIDLILCDINLPDVDGYDILKYVKSNSELLTLPFIFMTAYADPEDVRKGMNMGADDYITKPFSAEVLTEAVISRLNIKKQKDDLLNIEMGNAISFLNSNFNHEFMTPLNGILNAVNVLQSTNLDVTVQEIKDLVSAIAISGERMFKNIKLLTLYALFSRSDGIVADKNGFAYIYDLINAVKLYNVNVSFETEYVLNDDSKEFVLGSYDYLLFIIQELIDNAYKHSIEKSSVVFKTFMENNIYYMSFENSIDESIEFNFTDIAPFKKFHDDTSLNGLGLGLFVCKQIALKYDYVLKINIIKNKVVVTLGLPIQTKQ